MKSIQFSPWSPCQAKCFGVTGPYLEQHDSLLPGTTMNGIRYVELMQEKLGLHMHIHQYTIFIPESVLCHYLNVIQNFFLNRISVTTLDWPENSLDLKPSENLQKIIKNKVTEKQPPCTKALRLPKKSGQKKKKKSRSPTTWFSACPTVSKQ